MVLASGATAAADLAAFYEHVVPHRRELLAHCYRMCGSIGDAEDLLQETLVRAWKGLAAFEGRASLRTWLFRIATNTCLDMLTNRPARGLPEDRAPASDGTRFPPDSTRAATSYLEPCSGELDFGGSPDADVAERESVGLAFLAALQALPPKQRAVLLLRDVMGWEASECGELLGLSEAAVKSALQRARGAAEQRAGPTLEWITSAGCSNCVAAATLRSGVGVRRGDRSRLVAPRGRDSLDAAVAALASGARSDCEIPAKVRPA